TRTGRPTKTAYTALRQIVQWIPEGLPDRIALDALRKYGTAGGPSRPVIVGNQLCFQGFERFSNVPVG
ncbi:MAG: hypothetical protein PHG71_09155, partial [Kiritimatiellae bacterium]|nr:hypothetical protein [Kiritimatiellia bacterium]